MAFPTDAILLFDGISENPESGVQRTAMHDGMVKQLQTVSRTLKPRPLKYLLPSLAVKQAFEAWVSDDLNGGSAWFSWTDPADGQTKQARIVNGQVKYTPRVKSMERWFAELQLETYG